METNHLSIKERSKTDSFRNYDHDPLKAAVKLHYRKMRSRQTVEYVQRMKSKYLKFNKPMGLWDSIKKLDALIDVSDPDLDLPNIQHLLQSAEAIRADGRPDWMQLVGLIHDLGKIIYLWGCDEDGTSQNEQWGMVGDVFIVGCKLPDTCVYPGFNKLNPDMKDPRYNTNLGMYTAQCGIDNTLLAWGHDEYLYQVLSNHATNKIPKAGMVMTRYHSFYPWHSGGSYGEILSKSDQQYKEWILDFNQYDLYSKSELTFDLEKLKDHYLPIAKKYLGDGPIYW